MTSNSGNNGSSDPQRSIYGPLTYEEYESYRVGAIAAMNTAFETYPNIMDAEARRRNEAAWQYLNHINEEFDRRVHDVQYHIMFVQSFRIWYASERARYDAFMFELQESRCKAAGMEKIAGRGGRRGTGGREGY